PTSWKPSRARRPERWPRVAGEMTNLEHQRRADAKGSTRRGGGRARAAAPGCPVAGWTQYGCTRPGDSTHRCVGGANTMNPETHTRRAFLRAGLALSPALAFGLALPTALGVSAAATSASRLGDETPLGPTPGPTPIPSALPV